MWDYTDKDLMEWMEHEKATGVIIHYEKEAGADGKTTVRVSGTGAMVMDGLCEIIGNIARDEARRAENRDMAFEYVNLIRDLVTAELMEGFGLEGTKEEQKA